MLLETWVPEQKEAAVTPQRSSQNTPITDILLWTECFTLMVAMLAKCFQDNAPQLLAYFWRIVHAAKSLHGTAWVSYDRLYWNQAMAQCSPDWAKKDSTLYIKAYTGRQRPVHSANTA